MRQRNIYITGIKMNKFKSNFLSGFSLIEVVAVLAVFFLILGTAVSIFLSIIQSQKNILKEQDLLDQASYALEAMSRNIRAAAKDTTGSCISVGSIYSLTHFNVLGFYSGIKFIASDNSCTEYFLDVDGSLKSSKNG